MLANDHWFWNYGTISNFCTEQIFDYILVFVSRDFELGRVSVQFAHAFAITIAFARWRRRLRSWPSTTYGANFCILGLLGDCILLRLPASNKACDVMTMKTAMSVEETHSSSRTTWGRISFVLRSSSNSRQSSTVCWCDCSSADDVRITCELWPCSLHPPLTIQ